MAEPSIRFGSMPVFHVGGNDNDITGAKAPRRFSVLLIPAAPSHADEDLTAAAAGAVDVPVVAAARLKGDVGQKYGAFTGFDQRIEIGFSNKVLGKSRIFRTNTKNILLFKFCTHCLQTSISNYQT